MAKVSILLSLFLALYVSHITSLDVIGNFERKLGANLENSSLRPETKDKIRQHLSVIQGKRKDQTRESKTLSRHYLGTLLRTQTEDAGLREKGRGYYDQMKPIQPHNLRHTQNNINAKFSDDTTKTGFKGAGKSIVEVGKDPQFNSGDFRLSGKVENGRVINVDNNRGLAAHSLAGKPVQNLLITPVLNNQDALNVRTGNGRSISFDKNVAEDTPKSVTLPRNVEMVRRRTFSRQSTRSADTTRPRIPTVSQSKTRDSTRPRFGRRSRS
jgi:hypothetical protein